MFGSIAEGVEIVSRLISRYINFELAYLDAGSQGPSAAQLKLSEALVSLYAAILTYLAKTGRYYTRSNPERFARSVLQPAQSIESCLEAMLKGEMLIESFAQIIHVELTSTVTKNVLLQQIETTTKFKPLETLIKAFDDPPVRTMGALEYLGDRWQAEEQQSLLQWLSRIPYHEHHETAYQEVLPGTGLWLLQQADYLDWRISSSSSILWLHGIPGVGKSKFSAIIFQRLLDDAAGVENSAPIAYFYCSGDNAESFRADPTEILRDVLEQLSSAGSDGPTRPAIVLEYSTGRGGWMRNATVWTL